MDTSRQNENNVETSGRMNEPKKEKKIEVKMENKQQSKHIMKTISSRTLNFSEF